MSQTLQSLFFALASLIMLGYLLVLGRDIVMPFVIALFLWYLINALGRRLAQWMRIPKRFALLPAFIVVIGSIYFIITAVSGNVQGVMNIVANYQSTLLPYIDNWLTSLSEEDRKTFQDLLAQMNLSDVARAIVNGFVGITAQSVTIMLYMIFLFIEQSTFDLKVRAFFKTKAKQKHAREVLEQVGKNIENYVGLKTVMSVIQGILGFAILSFFDVGNAPLWAVMFGLLNYIPYIGPVIGVLLPSLAALVQFMDLSQALMIAASLGAVAFVIGNLIEPRLYGRSLNLSPMVVLSSLAIWGMMWGIMGMFLCIPIMVAITIILSNIEATRPYAALLSEKPKDPDVK